MVDQIQTGEYITVGDFTFFNGGAFPSDRILFETFVTAKDIKDRSRSACDYKIAANGVKKIDLLDGLRNEWEPLDQRSRGTCTAFAVAACMELMHLRKGNKISFSTQFIYWNMREKFPDPSIPYWNEGATRAGQALKVIEDFGCCTKEKLDYPNTYDPENISGPPPDDRANEEAKKFKAKAIDYYLLDLHGKRRKLAEAIIDHLNDGRPVAVGVPMYRIKDVAYPDGFTNNDTLITGIVKGPPALCALGLDIIPERVSAHQICIVGFQLDSKADGGGWFIFKNSWGYAFATSPKAELDRASKPKPPFVPGRGYGAISAAYLNEFCWEYLCIDLV